MVLRSDGYPALRANGQPGRGDPTLDLSWAGLPATEAPGDLVVPGVLLELCPGASSMIALDLFEGYAAGDPNSEYVRILVPVCLENDCEAVLMVWTYACLTPDPAWPAIASWPPPGAAPPAPYAGSRPIEPDSQ